MDLSSPFRCCPIHTYFLYISHCTYVQSFIVLDQIRILCSAHRYTILYAETASVNVHASCHAPLLLSCLYPYLMPCNIIKCKN